MFGIGTARSWLEPSGAQLEIGRVEERDGGDELGDGVRVVVVDVDRGGRAVGEDRARLGAQALEARLLREPALDPPSQAPQNMSPTRAVLWLPNSRGVRERAMVSRCVAYLVRVNGRDLRDKGGASGRESGLLSGRRWLGTHSAAARASKAVRWSAE